MDSTLLCKLGRSNRRKAGKRKLPGRDEPPEGCIKSPYFNTSSLLTPSKGTLSPSTSRIDTSMATTPLKNPQRLGSSFFRQPCIQLAKRLLGQILVRVVDGHQVAGRIVETEAYVGAEDTASNTFKGRRTASNKSMFLTPGHAYVYLTYGMYHCINITCKGEGQAVLLRALAPTDGLDAMRKLRQEASKRPNRQFKTKDLCNGPGKLCMALDITRSLDGTNLTSSSSMWMESGAQVLAGDIVSCPRIGIDSATKEWVEKPLRFYVKGEPCVSRRNRGAEGNLV